MVNHYDLARELFYQLALARFGEPQIASLGGRINVKVVLEQALQCEEIASTLLDTQKDSGDENDTFLLKVSETNSELAQQAADCLEDKAEMLKEYYGISLESCCGTNGSNDRELYLTGLPVLLEGYIPSPHALPIFFLRLATEVDWSEEESCFNGICTELAYFYADLVFTGSSPRHETDERQRIPLLDEAANKALRHQLFPAFSLLVPPKEFETDGTISRLAGKFI
jgi:DNA mismatch repair protein MLH1